MSNMNSPELREAFSKIRSLQLPTEAYEAGRSKLAVLLVKAGLKRACLHLAKSTVDGFTAIGLNVFVAGLPPPYYYGSPHVPRWFVTEYFHIAQIERQQTKGVWFYADEATYSKILASLNGDLDDGYVLDYPECCVKWYETMVTKEIEILYRYIRDRYAFQTRTEVIDALVHSEARFFSHRFVQNQTSVSFEQTVRQFPFIFHIACPACLKGSNESAALNAKYEQVALTLERVFHQELVAASREYIEKLKDSRSRYTKEFSETKKRFPVLGTLEKILNTE